MKPFDPLHSITREPLLLEASAGTGKTYSISGKVVRLIVEAGIDIDRILIVTFTKAATAELVDRIRAILVEARDAIDRDEEADHIVINALLGRAKSDAGFREQAVARLKRAIARFDLASIFTIHGFAERALSLVAFEIGYDPSAELNGNIDDAIYRAADDLFLEALERNAAARAGGVTEVDLRTVKHFNAETLRKIAKERWGQRDAKIAELEEKSPFTEAIERFSNEIVERIESELEKRNAFSFDQLIHHLKRAIEDEKTRDGLITSLRARYDAALIDEFQDTDEAQWTIFRAIFGEGKIFELVGDPKQAIYSFRGADIEVYKRARRAAVRRFTLTTNYRSTPEYIEAMNVFFGTSGGLEPPTHEPETSFPFASEEIPYLKVGANLAADPPRLVARDGAPFTPLRILRCAIGQDEQIGVEAARHKCNRVAVDEVLDILHRGEFRRGSERRAVRPSDIAILVRTKNRGSAIAQLLRERGVRCVSPKESPLFKSEAATIVENLLQLSLDPTDRRVLRSLAFGPLFRIEPSEFDEDEERLLESQIAKAVEEFREGLSTLGVGANLLRLLSRPFERLDGEQQLILFWLLRREDGERLITDLRHLAEELHIEALERHLSPAAILKLLQDRRSGTDVAEDEEYAIRLESDADALTIATIHASKGLEYPIVFLPDLDEARSHKSDHILLFNEDGQRHISPFLGAQTDPLKDKANQMAAEEALRLLYVAFTRARHHCVAFFHPPYRHKPSKNNPKGALKWGSVLDSALAHIVYRDGDGGDVKEAIDAAAKSEDLAPIDAIGEALAQRSVVNGEARIDYRIIEQFANQPPYQGEHAVEELQPPADYEGSRSFFSFFGRHSYTQVVRYGREAVALGELSSIELLGDHGGSDEGHALEGFDESEGAEAIALPLASFPKGARPGTFIHFLLEELDFTSGAPKDAERTLEELMRRSAARAGFFGEGRESFHLIEAALPGILKTPLGGSLGDRSLSELSVDDRLDELDFVLPIAADSAEESPRVEVGALPDIFGRGRATPLQYQIEGFMNGSMDLVFRAPDVEGQLRYYLADYKSNALGGAEAYEPERLREAMDTHEYWVQAAFYLLALDSFLAHRLGESYEYERDFGGVYYLFLRGMTGEDARLPDGSGVRGVLALRPREAEMVRLRQWLREGQSRKKLEKAMQIGAK